MKCSKVSCINLIVVELWCVYWSEMCGEVRDRMRRYDTGQNKQVYAYMHIRNFAAASNYSGPWSTTSTWKAACLEQIRSILIHLNDTITCSLIERTQVAHNPKIYECSVFKKLRALQFSGIWFKWFLKMTEMSMVRHSSQYSSGIIAKAWRPREILQCVILLNCRVENCLSTLAVKMPLIALKVPHYWSLILLNIYIDLIGNARQTTRPSGLVQWVRHSPRIL